MQGRLALKTGSAEPPELPPPSRASTWPMRERVNDYVPVTYTVTYRCFNRSFPTTIETRFAVRQKLRHGHRPGEARAKIITWPMSRCDCWMPAMATALSSSGGAPASTAAPTAARAAAASGRSFGSTAACSTTFKIGRGSPASTAFPTAASSASSCAINGAHSATSVTSRHRSARKVERCGDQAG